MSHDHHLDPVCKRRIFMQNRKETQFTITMHKVTCENVENRMPFLIAKRCMLRS